MGVRIVRGKTLPIGVDLGSSAVKMAQLRQTDVDYELVAAGRAEVPAECRKDFSRRLAALSKSIRAILRAGTFKGRRCTLSIPAESTFVHHVKIPKLPAEETNLAVQKELAGKLPYPLEEAIVRHVVAGDTYDAGELKQEVIVVAASRATVEDYLEMARRASLDVLSVNIEPCAIVECFARLFRRADDARRTVLFVDIGAVSTQVVLAHGNKIAFARNLSGGGQQIDGAIAEGMGVSCEQAQAMRRDLRSNQAETAARDELYRLLQGSLDKLSEELMQCLRYYESVFRGRSIERAIFIGGQAHDKRLCQSLAQRLNLPAQIGDPLLRIGSSGEFGPSPEINRREPQPDWTVAVGLSLGALTAA